MSTLPIRRKMRSDPLGMHDSDLHHESSSGLVFLGPPTVVVEAKVGLVSPFLMFCDKNIFTRSPIIIEFSGSYCDTVTPPPVFIITQGSMTSCLMLSF